MTTEVIDEHQEAYLSIEQAVHAGILRPPIALVHVDSHDDLDCPVGGLSCYEVPSRRYVEQNLTTGDFIMPLILNGYVQTVIHVNFKDEQPVNSTVGSLNGKGALIRRNIAPEHLRFYPDRKKWVLQKTSDIAALSKFVRGFDTVLGIDCDYFAWNRIPRPEFPFGLSPSQRRRMNRNATSDDRHRLKLCILPHQFPAINRLVFNDSKAWVKLFIDYFCFYLKMVPKLTVIARSAKTGFTPRRFARLIETRLTKRLTCPPTALEIPVDEKLVLSPFVARKGPYWYSFSTHERMMQHPLERLIVSAASKGLKIGLVRDRLLAVCARDQFLADYLLLRTIFNLKKAFILE
jgi:hypothetical protein